MSQKKKNKQSPKQVEHFEKEIIKIRSEINKIDLKKYKRSMNPRTGSLKK